MINHKFLSELRIYENIWIKDSVAILSVFWFLQYRTRPVGIPDTSGIHRTETLTFCPWPYRTRPEVIPDTSDRFRIEPIKSLHVIFLFSFIIYCILASQQINYSTRERSKASYGKHDKSQVKLISHFHYFTNVPICEL